jgi:hypothetical protein
LNTTEKKELTELIAQLDVIKSKLVAMMEDTPEKSIERQRCELLLSAHKKGFRPKAVISVYGEKQLINSVSAWFPGDKELSNKDHSDNVINAMKEGKPFVYFSYGKGFYETTIDDSTVKICE